MSHGRVDEALAWSRRARELDPLGKTGDTIGWMLFQARRYDDSIRELRSFLAVYPNDAIAHLILAFPMIANGQAEEAIPDLEKTATMMHRSPGALELAHSARYAPATVPKPFGCLRIEATPEDGLRPGYLFITRTWARQL
jgi:tetratricopeptide (TPR) repeat protein